MCALCTAPQPPDATTSQLLLHTQVYEITDKCDVLGLKVLAKERFHRATTKYWNTEEFSGAAEHALTTTPESDGGIRQAVYGIIVAKPQLMNKPIFEALLTKHAGFAFQALKRLAIDTGRLKPSTTS
jgi:hypothetical protein